MDEYFMKEALRFAEYGRGFTSPNPMVGAVIVKNGQIVGTGWHRKAGTPHAEIHALNMAGDLAKDATLYVTLEPCSHTGRTGPCADAIINAGISRVVAAMRDPNPKVQGNGIKKLQDANIKITMNVLKEEAEKLNVAYIKWMTENTPFVNLKIAMTLDGKIATKTGESKWITGEAAREEVHKLRAEVDAIIVGINTVIADNPSLTTRLQNCVGKNSIRVILDSNGKIPLNSKVLTDNQAKTIVAVSETAPTDKIEAIKNIGSEVLVLGENKVDLKLLLNTLAKKNITSVLVEGGGEVYASFIEQKLFDRIYAFIAPKILGGVSSKLAVPGAGFPSLNDALKLCNVEVKRFDEDILIVGDKCYE